MVQTLDSDRYYLLRWVEEMEPTQLDSASLLPNSTIEDLYASQLEMTNPNWARVRVMQHFFAFHVNEESYAANLKHFVGYSIKVGNIPDDIPRSDLLTRKIKDCNLFSATFLIPRGAVNVTSRMIDSSYGAALQLLIISSPRPESVLLGQMIDELIGGSITPSYCSLCEG